MTALYFKGSLASHRTSRRYDGAAVPDVDTDTVAFRQGVLFFGPLGAGAAHRAAADRIGGRAIVWRRVGRAPLLPSAAMTVRVCALVRSDVGWRALARLLGGCGIARAPWRFVSGR